MGRAARPFPHSKADVRLSPHLGIDPFADLRDALPGLFTLGEKPMVEQLLDWLPDRWLLNRTRTPPRREMTTG